MEEERAEERKIFEIGFEIALVFLNVWGRVFIVLARSRVFNFKSGET